MAEETSTTNVANVTQVIYKVSPFDATKAAQGALCVIVKPSHSAETWNIDSIGKVNDNFLGAGICRKESAECFSMIVDSVYYQFYADGTGRYPDEVRDYVLKLAEPKVNLKSAGNSAISGSTVASSRGSDGKITTTVQYEQESDIIIDDLNARDEFAVNALRELLSHVKDPSVMSNNEMAFYCNRAYQWASNMMSASAEARGTFKDADTTTTGTTSRANIATSSLSTPTEKLLNNIVNALERDDYVETITTTDATTGKTTTTTNYYDRVKVQFTELMTFLNTYIKKDEKTVYSFKDLVTPITTLSTVLSTYVKKDDKTVVGLKDLISPLTTLSSALNTYIKKDSTTTVGLNDLITAVNAVKTSADNIKTSNEDLLKTIINVSNTQSIAINDLQNTADSQSDSIDNLESVSSNLVENVSNLQNKVYTLQTKVTANTDDISSLDKTVTSQGARITSLSNAISSCMTQSEVDARVKAWLNATTIVSDGSGGYKLSVPGSI